LPEITNFTDVDLLSKLFSDLDLIESDTQKMLTDEIKVVIMETVKIVLREKPKYIK